MRARSVFNSINPFTGLAGVSVMGILLVATIFLTIFDLPWIAFLTGILCAAAIGLISRLAHAETTLAEVRENVRYVDVELPIMIVYVAADGTVRYHNQAFRTWLRARESTINGRPLRDAVGLTIFAHLKNGLDAALAGHRRQETRTHEGLGSPDTRLFTQYMPHFGERESVVGAFILQTDVTAMGEQAAAMQPVAAALPHPLEAAQAPAVVVDSGTPAGQEIPRPAPPSPQNGGEPERRIFVDTMTEELTDWRNAADRLRAALDNDEFCLYAQVIAPLSAPAPAAGPFYEILLRLREEEEGLMPPGAFIPLAEEYGLMPDLDRWVVRNVLKWAIAKPERRNGVYSINISSATIENADFPEFVVSEIRRHGAAGSLLCFELMQEEVLSRRGSATRLVEVLAEAGCHTALCGFGQSADDYSLLKVLRVDHLKIDGDIVLGLARSPIDLIKLKAICRVARTTNRRTIAEFVENEETIATLREYGVDFAQGFGIGRPRPLSDLG